MISYRKIADEKSGIINVREIAKTKFVTCDENVRGINVDENQINLCALVF